MVKQGYKPTEIGVIPEDWEVKELGEVLTFGSGRDYKHLKSGEIPVYGTGGIMTYIDDFLYQGESVGIGRKGTIDKPVYLTGKFWTVDTLFYTHNFKDILPKYAFYQFGRIPWKEYNEASGVPSLNKNTLSNIQIPLPPLAEQEAITSALSDADAWIDRLEQLIAKKRFIKQGAMQELLTPKEDWEVKKLGEVLKSVGSGTSNTFSDGQKFPIYGSTGVIGFKNYYDYEGDNITVARVGANAGRVNIINGKYCVSDNTLILVSSNEIKVKFLFYLLITANLNNLVFGSGQPLITGGQLKVLEIPLPSLSEQERIATILSDMDAELEALEKQLGKTRQIKQGMMQELLMGRVRLI